MIEIKQTAAEFFSRPRETVYGGEKSEGSSWERREQVVCETGVSTLVVVVGDDRFGIEVGLVNSLVANPRIHALPGYLKQSVCIGLFNYRGRILPALELGRLVSLGDSSRQHGVIVEFSGRVVILTVDAVLGIIRIPASEVASVSQQTPVEGVVTKDSQRVAILRTTDLKRMVEEAVV